MSVECQVNVKSQSELDIGGRETCLSLLVSYNVPDSPGILESSSSVSSLVSSSKQVGWKY